MPNRVTIVAGCQRSGTTLLSLILDSHPEIRTIDEVDFRLSDLRRYLTSKEFAPLVCFKLPAMSHRVREFKSLPGLKVLWAVRDPRDVVTSMIRLQVTARGVKAPLAAHPHAGPALAIPPMLEVLGEPPADLRQHLDTFRRLPSHPDRTIEQLALAAALHWRLKCELLPAYDECSVPYRFVRYEDVVRSPKAHISQVLEYLDLEWHDAVLRHHETHDGVSIGFTDRSRAIDQASIETWQPTLTTNALACVNEVCGAKAQRFGYRLERTQARVRA